MPDGYTLTAGPTRSAEMTREVAALDAQLFDAIFTHCNADEVAKLVVDDLEFYHDEWGFDPSVDFVESIRGMCKRVQSGEDGKLRLARVISYDHVLAPGGELLKE